MKRRLRAVRQGMLYRWWPLRAVMRRLQPRALVLLYHRVGDTSFDPHRLSVTPPSFERHMQLLRRHFRIESVGALLQRLPGREYEDRTVAVTFDDGYADNLTHAQPIAARSDIPITVFVTVQPMLDGGLFWWDELAASLLHPLASFTSLTLHLDDQHTFSLADRGQRSAVHQRLHTLLRHMRAGDRERALAAVRSCAAPPGVGLQLGRPMSASELRELAALPGVTIGAHTMTHPILGVLSATDQMHELVASKTALEDLLGRPVTLASYPFGQAADISEDTCRLAMQAGYSAAFTTMPSAVTPSTPRCALPRLIVHDWPDETLMRRLSAYLG